MTRAPVRVFRRMARALGVLVAVLLAALPPTAAEAQPFDQPTLQPLSGVLKRIKDTRVVHLGVRASAVPFSTINGAGQAAGYSVDLCRAIVDEIAETIGTGSLAVEFRTVTPADRLDQVVAGRIDLECGATTNTAARREQVAFSPPIFIAGTRLVVRRGSPVRSIADLAGRQVAVVRGTTNEAVMRQWAADAQRRMTIVAFDDYDAAIASVGAGTAAALAADDALLAGHLADTGRRREFAIVGGLLSYEPYGIVFAKDDVALAEVVQRTFVRLAGSGEIRSIYARWFLRPLPSGARLDWPMSPQLARSFEMLGMRND